jgi:hypothetical protein
MSFITRENDESSDQQSHRRAGKAQPQLLTLVHVFDS